MEINLVAIVYEGELVLRCPIEVLDREKARAALLGCADRGTLYGIDGGTLGMLLKATSDSPSAEEKATGLFIQYSQRSLFVAPEEPV